MSTHSGALEPSLASRAVQPATGGLWAALQMILRPLASLKLTVTLFAFSMLLIFVGTLAQYEMNMWEVIHVYFRSFVAQVDLQVFFPKSFFPWFKSEVPGRIWIPGGKTLGIALIVNLFAAHLLRFKLQATGRRLWAGLGVIALGAFLTTLIILSGHRREGLQGLPMISWDALWMMIRVAILLTWIGTVVLLISVDRSRKIEFYLLLVLSILLGGVALYLVARGDTARLNDSALRILWQLTQGGLAGILLLVGCVMVFRRRGGIVLIHVGIGLMMLGELLVGVSAVEEQMTLAEGETSTFARDIRDVELTIIDRSQPEHDTVVAVPLARLRTGQVLTDEQLPFDIEVVEFFKNSTLRRLGPSDVNRATAGVVGKTWFVEPRRPVGGAASGDQVDVASLYLKVLPKSDDADSAVETYLLSQFFGDSDVLLVKPEAPVPEVAKLEDRQFDMFLRYKRNYGKPYHITLHDVRKEDYLGTSTPQDYSSWISLSDPSRDFERDRIRIWMNNPLRYSGETFYQSGYAVRPDGTEVTTLQIVTNTGWMIPYVACMLVLTGMLYHFCLTLLRFVKRQAQARARQSGEATVGFGPGVVFPLIVAAIFGCYVLGRARLPEVEHDGMRMDRFGQIPIVYGGRIKPIDTLARNTLRSVSNKQTFRVPQQDDDTKTEKEPALVWLLDAITLSDEAKDHRVFRIDSLDVLATLGLERRKGFLYSVNDVRDGIKEFEAKVDDARVVAQKDAALLDHEQKKILETDRRLRTYSKLQSAFLPIPFPPVPTKEDHAADPAAAKATIEEISRLAAATPSLNKSLIAMQPPLAVPLSRAEDLWLPFAAAINESYVQQIFSGERPDRRVMQWTQIIGAYSEDDAKGFNRAVTAYLKDLKQDPPKGYKPAKVKFEAFFNAFQPFTVAMALYVVAFLLTAMSWMGWFEPLRRAATSIVILAFAVHTFALVARIMISGRPPVTNLYSSAVFIGWGCAVLAIALEFIFKLGIGNVVAAVVGFATLLIAHLLAFGGDTFTVLQAVLDTQFWLATHVVCITLGYAATFAAGAFAIVYILAKLFVVKLDDDVTKILAGIIYGIVCFAMFFSFVGTVLGGLWADDSWGRFWGWDPKENGALMIVLWNAIILHARWGGMIRARGLAVLAVLGNVVTAWSWFGVNELGIGLHSYGFTDGVLRALSIFALSQIVIAGLGMFVVRSGSTKSPQPSPA